LKKCVEAYSLSTVANHASKIWNALKYEIWNGENEDFIGGSLQVLGAVTMTLNNASYDWRNNNNEMTRYVAEAANECKAKIPDSKREMPACGRILKAIVSSSPYAFHLVANIVLPAVFVFWQDWQLPSEKKLLLSVFNDLVEAQLAQANASTSDTVISISLEKMNATFAGFRDQIIDVYFDALPKAHVDDISDHAQDHSLELTAIKGIALLFRSPTYLSDSEANLIVSDLCRVALSAGTSADIYESIIAALTEISTANPDIFEAIILAQFIGRLPNSLSPDAHKHKEELALVVSTLDNLLKICTKHCTKEYRTGAPSGINGSFWHRNFDATMSKLFAVLDRALEQKEQEDYAKAIIAAFLIGLERFDGELDRARLIEAEPEPQTLGEGPYTWILMRLLKLVVEVKQCKPGLDSKNKSIYIGISNFPGSNHCWNEKIVEYVGIVALLVERSLLTRRSGNDPIRNWIVKNPDEPSVIWTLFSDSVRTKSLGESQCKLEEGPEDKCLAVALSMYLLAGFKPKVFQINKSFSILANIS
jgi:DNA repair/transcription protein MET18/MMS19